MNKELRLWLFKTHNIIVQAMMSYTQTVRLRQNYLSAFFTMILRWLQTPAGRSFTIFLRCGKTY